MSSESETPRPALVIRALEGRRTKDRPVLTAERYEAQLLTLAGKGIRPPLEERRS